MEILRGCTFSIYKSRKLLQCFSYSLLYSAKNEENPPLDRLNWTFTRKQESQLFESAVTTLRGRNFTFLKTLLTF
jgi:hypothetical protein